MKIRKSIRGGTLPGRYFTIYDVTSCLKLQKEKKNTWKKNWICRLCNKLQNISRNVRKHQNALLSRRVEFLLILSLITQFACKQRWLV